MIDLDYIGSMYPNVVRIWKAVTTNTGEEYAILYYSLEWFFFSVSFCRHDDLKCTNYMFRHSLRL